MYPMISSGFLKNSLLSCCLILVLRKSISDISAAILKIIKIRILLLTKMLPLKLTIINIIHNKIDSLIRQFGFSKLCALYRK